MNKDKILRKLPDGRDWLCGKLGLALMGRAMFSKSLIQFSLDGWGCVPSLWFGLTYASIPCCSQDCVFSAPEPSSGHCWPTPPPETPGHSQANLAESLVGSLLLSLGSWCAQGLVCALQESVSPVMWTFCNQIPLAFKVKFLGGSQSICQIPRLGNLLRVLGLLQPCQNFFDIIVLQFVGHLFHGSMVMLMATSSTRIYDICSTSQVCCNQSPCPRGDHCWSMPP